MTNTEYEKIIAAIKGAKMTDDMIQALEKTVEEDASTMTVEQYQGIKEAIAAAKESTVPYAVVKGDKVAVIGDANKTEARPGTYKIKFVRMNDDGDTEEEIEYKNIRIVPRIRMDVVQLFVGLLPYFKKISDDGTISDYTMPELINNFAFISREVKDAMYEVVATVLRIPEEEKDYMKWSSVLNTTMSMITDNPDIVNEAEMLFTSLSVSPK